MIAAALVILSLATGLYLVRLIIGPSVPDRVLALDSILVTVVCGVLAGAARADSTVSVDTVLVVALAGFIATGVLSRYIEKRGG